MAERVDFGPLGVRNFQQELRVDRRPEGAHEGRLLRAGYAKQQIEVESLPDDRGMQQDILSVRRQCFEPFENRVSQRVGDRDLGDLLRPPPRPFAELDVPTLDERTQDLFHKEWIALAGLEYGRAELDGRWPVQFHGLAQEVGDLILAQPAERDVVGDASPAQLRQYGPERMPPMKFVGAVCADEQKGHLAELVCEMREELK